jgi:hypothetical protein
MGLDSRIWDALISDVVFVGSHGSVRSGFYSGSSIIIPGEYRVSFFLWHRWHTLSGYRLFSFFSLKVYYLFLPFSGSDSGGRSAHCTLRIADRSISSIFTSSSQKDAFCTPLTFSYVNIVTVLRKSLLCHYTFRKDAFVPGKQFWDESFTYCTLCLADLDFSFSIVSSLSQSSHHFLITNLSQHTSKTFSFLLHGSEREVGVSTSLNRSPPQKNKFLE